MPLVVTVQASSGHCFVDYEVSRSPDWIEHIARKYVSQGAQLCINDPDTHEVTLYYKGLLTMLFWRFDLMPREYIEGCCLMVVRDRADDIVKIAVAQRNASISDFAEDRYRERAYLINDDMAQLRHGDRTIQRIRVAPLRDFSENLSARIEWEG